ncbi:30S ribosomal protein S8 [Patescibacteria group bacterium]|nr:30S ribosomal protein S8 [Patescibacteria group bacterium]MCL5409338.1 30S ribosomal protein S8 [Patescibacteria group bacterium]
MDKVGDLLIRIKNGYMAAKLEVIVPYSKLSMAICHLLRAEGYIEDFKNQDREIVVKLRYENRKPALSGVTRISKPGRRVYKGNSSIPRVYNGLGVAIISTPKGIMSDDQARKEKLGGEIMAFVW